MRSEVRFHVFYLYCTPCDSNILHLVFFLSTLFPLSSYLLLLLFHRLHPIFPPFISTISSYFFLLFPSLLLFPALALFFLFCCRIFPTPSYSSCPSLHPLPPIFLISPGLTLTHNPPYTFLRISSIFFLLSLLFVTLVFLHILVQTITYSYFFRLLLHHHLILP